jgi:hypothetical protein
MVTRITAVHASRKHNAICCLCATAPQISNFLATTTQLANADVHFTSITAAAAASSPVPGLLAQPAGQQPQPPVATPPLATATACCLCCCNCCCCCRCCCSRSIRVLDRPCPAALIASTLAAVAAAAATAAAVPAPPGPGLPSGSQPQ